MLCLEEPENGIHPERIPAMLQLLRDIATDAAEPVGEDNPLRQVIINTHSPAVVSEVPEDSLVVAELKETVRHGQRFQSVRFGCLPGTWRETNAPEGEEVNVIAKGKLLAYLNPVSAPMSEPEHNGRGMSIAKPSTRARRVVDRPDLQPLLPFGKEP